MTQRKHTACSICGSRGMCRFLEVLWRQAFSGPWHWRAGWFCASCHRAQLDFIGSMGPWTVLDE